MRTHLYLKGQWRMHPHLYWGLIGFLFGLIVISQLRISKTYGQTPVNRSPQPNFDVRRFSPPMDSQGFALTERSVGLKTFNVNLGLYVDSAFSPLSQKIQGTSYALVDRYTTGQINFAIGFFERLTIGLSQPFVILSGDLDGPGALDPFNADGLGDTHLLLKVIAFNSKKSPVGLALMSDFAFATSPTHPLASDYQSPLIHPTLIIDTEFKYVAVSTNVGYLMRQARLFADPVIDLMGNSLVRDPIELGAELSYRFGVSGRYIPGFFHQSFEVIGGHPLGQAQNGQWMELASSLRFIFDEGSHLTLGVSRGLIDGYNQPSLRAFMGITFHPKQADRDRDGIPDKFDQCPSQAEDLDQFEDTDGCPEDDNDRDGIVDRFDQCPNQKEDVNDFEDEDGCPDGQIDQDRDGIIDRLDQCPRIAEDRDQFEDSDGCPEDDNDEDGIKDDEDQCVNESEDWDAFQDLDGCPDRDNDQDGILDVNDRCPHDPEEKNGIDDDDGCPDAKPKPKSNIEKEGDRLVLKGKVFFETGKAKIKRKSYTLLFEFAIFLNQNPSFTLIEIQGHTDQRGKVSQNQRLSEKRAQAVRRFLIKQGSVDENRLTSRGYGSSQPLIDEESEEAYRRNRRVEFKVLESTGEEINE